MFNAEKTTLKVAQKGAKSDRADDQESLETLKTFLAGNSRR